MMLEHIGEPQPPPRSIKAIEKVLASLSSAPRYLGGPPIPPPLRKRWRRCLVRCRLLMSISVILSAMRSEPRRMNAPLLHSRGRQTFGPPSAFHLR